MHLLLIGGTRFTGRFLSAAAVEAGHRVTLLHRGVTEPGWLREHGVEHVLADRRGDLSVVRGRAFDAVVDFCGYAPRAVAGAAAALGDVGWYGFVSTISVYAAGLRPGGDEADPLHVALRPDPEPAALTAETYGPMKVACEQQVRAAFGDRACVVRPGYIVGPWDPSDRFTAFVRRAARGGDIVVPGDPADPLQFVDARDLAAFLLRLATTRATGAFDAIHPGGAVSVGDVVRWAGGRPVGRPLAELRAAAGERADDAWPLWDPDEPACHRRSGAKAAAAGLPSRPGADTVRDTLAWDAEHPERRTATDS